VKVTSQQLHRWYRTLDALLAAKKDIEQALYLRVRDLFSVQVDLVFYDITSTYFQRREPIENLRRHGKSRDGKPRETQVVVGVVMANGWPIAHHVFPGNTADKTTLQEVMTDLHERFGLRRVMIVADRGMVNPANLEFLSGRQYGYLVAIQGRRNKEAAAVLAELREEEGAWTHIDDDNRTQEASLAGRRERYFVVESKPRREYEQRLRERSMNRARADLEGVARSVETGRLKDPAKIGARAAKALSRNHGSRYFSYEVPGRGQFRFREDADKMRAELAREGRYILKTEDPSMTPVDAVETYKQLNTVEAGFRDLKDVIEMRPVWHKKDERICAHIFVATLALFLKRTLQHELERKGLPFSATDALAALKSIGLDELDLNGERHRVVSSGGRDARRVLKALGISDANPPGGSVPQGERCR
jgi:transposase